MVMTGWWELRGGFIEGDVIKWRDPVWKKGNGGNSFGGQRLVCAGRRLISAEVLSEPDEDGWCYLLVRQYDNHGMTPLDKILTRPPVGKKIKRKYKTIMNGEPERMAWEDESARARLVGEAWRERSLTSLMTMDDDEEET